MPSRSDSQTESLIREWLFRFGVNFQRDVAPYLPLWLETFGGMEPEVLSLLFERAMRTYTFFPRLRKFSLHSKPLRKAASRMNGRRYSITSSNGFTQIFRRAALDCLRI